MKCKSSQILIVEIKIVMHCFLSKSFWTISLFRISIIIIVVKIFHLNDHHHHHKKTEFVHNSSSLYVITLDSIGLLPLYSHIIQCISYVCFFRLPFSAEPNFCFIALSLIFHFCLLLLLLLFGARQIDGARSTKLLTRI